MIHHALKHAVRHVGKLYAANPHKLTPHAAAATQKRSMVWTHRNKVARHTVNFMTKAAVRGFNLFRS